MKASIKQMALGLTSLFAIAAGNKASAQKADYKLLETLNDERREAYVRKLEKSVIKASVPYFDSVAKTFSLFKRVNELEGQVIKLSYDESNRVLHMREENLLYSSPGCDVIQLIEGSDRDTSGVIGDAPHEIYVIQLAAHYYRTGMKSQAFIGDATEDRHYLMGAKGVAYAMSSSPFLQVDSETLVEKRRKDETHSESLKVTSKGRKFYKGDLQVPDTSVSVQPMKAFKEIAHELIFQSVQKPEKLVSMPLSKWWLNTVNPPTLAAGSVKLAVQ